MNYLTRRPSLLLLCALISVAIAAPAKESEQSGSSDCNVGITAGLGALAGGLLGRKDRAKGAAIGAGIAALACVAVNYQSKQVKSADQVDREFKQKNSGAPPENTTLVKYETRFDPSNRIRAGAGATLSSYIEIVQGSKSGEPTVEEEIAIFGPDGKELKKTRKVANTNGAAGAFQSTFHLTMPEGVPQGMYPFKTTLFIDGVASSASEPQLQVVWRDGNMKEESAEGSPSLVSQLQLGR
jgi:hypothetical protein